ncbi:MAG: tRNA (adenosine(37)-N6)-dimethylallyltransferase MiaA [Rhodospirillales bacterium]
MTERMGARGGAGADATGDSGDARPLSTGARPVVVVAGPTASGKSTLALDLARARGGVVVNADAMQCYADLRVLTARPGPADEAAAPHRLYGTEPDAGRMTAIRWREAALAEIAAAHAAGRLPILVGGSGLYLKALMEGLPAMPAVPDAVRSAVAARMAAEGPAALHGWLASRDPATAARLAPGDRQRIARAVEVLEATGRPQSDWLAGPASPPPPGLRFVVAVLDPPRDALYAACDRRFGAMLAAGAIEEVRALVARGLAPDLPVMKVIGVPELSAVLAGTMPLADAAARARQATRNYAKRQVTWFRHQMTAAHGSHVTILRSPPGTASDSLPDLLVRLDRAGE